MLWQNDNLGMDLMIHGKLRKWGCSSLASSSSSIIQNLQIQAGDSSWEEGWIQYAHAHLETHEFQVTHSLYISLLVRSFMYSQGE
ncbi:hypothetical protein COP2_009686 [Malus domestica]